MEKNKNLSYKNKFSTKFNNSSDIAFKPFIVDSE